MTAMVRIIEMRRGLVQIFVRTENSDLTSKVDLLIGAKGNVSANSFELFSAYLCYNSVTNLPSTDMYLVFTFGYGSSQYDVNGYTAQLAIKVGGVNNLYIRQRLTGSWSAWSTYTGTGA